MLRVIIFLAFLNAQSQHPGKVSALLSNMNDEIQIELHDSKPETLPQVKAWMPEISKERTAAFYSRIDTSGGPESCWPFFYGFKHPFGYGAFTIDGIPKGTHRIAYALKNGPIPFGMVVMHKCDNPPCCNPFHLLLGTAADNARDMYRKGRQQKIPTGKDSHRANHPEVVSRGEECSWAKLTERDVIEIRKRYSLGETNSRMVGLEYNVSEATIRHVTKRDTWRHVE